MNAVIQEVRRALTTLFEEGQIVELRALGVTLDRYTQDKTFGGYFDDFDKLAEQAAQLPARGVYVTLNPPDRRLLARCYNRLEKSPKHTTADHEVPRRTRILIDADPVRYSGIPATTPEHEAALARAEEIARTLAGYGWPEPLRGDSGNGGHLIYGINLPARDGGLVQRVLEAVAFLFDDDRVKVDTTVFNPARITRLYGTVNRKGDACLHLDMPHRLARIISASERLEVVTQEQLEQIAAMRPEVTR